MPHANSEKAGHPLVRLWRWERRFRIAHGIAAVGIALTWIALIISLILTDGRSSVIIGPFYAMVGLALICWVGHTICRWRGKQIQKQFVETTERDLKAVRNPHDYL